MKKILSLLTLLTASMLMHASVHSYTPDNMTIFKNPERGYTEEYSYGVSDGHPSVLVGSLGENYGNKYNMSLVMVLYNFKYFKDQDISEKVLAGFDADMQLLRDRGLKCVLRFAYTEKQEDTVDATPEWVKRHLEQLKPHLAAAADVIYVLEAGFIGAWGEWYYTSHYGNESQHMNENRKKVIEALFENAPIDRFILFRYPMIKTEYLNNKEPLPAEEAFTGTVRARMGCHNDAFLNDWGNHGTYKGDTKNDDPAVREYVSKETLYVPNGGETNVEKDGAAEKVYADAPAEMSEYHWSFCGSSYATAVTKRWRESGIFDLLNVRMGYRYNLIRAQFSDEAAPGGKANITISICNSGYAPIYNERPAYIVLKNGSQSYSLPLKSDPRRWLPNYEVSTICEQVDIPADMPEGTYHLYLYLPDKYASLAADPRFAVRFANEGVWDAETGLNDLGAEIAISASASADPGPLEGLAEPSVQNTAYKKILDNGILYILTPDGRKLTANGNSCF